MRTFLERQPAWAVWAGCAAVAATLTVMAYGWMVRPHHDRQQEVKQLNETAQAEHAEAENLDQQYEAIHTAMAQRREALAANPLKLGDRRELNRRIAALIDLAQRQGVEVLQLQPGEVTRGKDYDLLYLRLEAVATFSQYLTMLDALHTSFPDMSVVALELDSPPRAATPRPRGAFELVWFTSVRDGANPGTSAAAGR